MLMVADYNGWADQREEEREALDLLEMTPSRIQAELQRQSPPLLTVGIASSGLEPGLS